MFGSTDLELDECFSVSETFLSFYELHRPPSFTDIGSDDHRGQMAQRSTRGNPQHKARDSPDVESTRSFLDSPG